MIDEYFEGKEIQFIIREKMAKIADCETLARRQILRIWNDGEYAHIFAIFYAKIAEICQKEIQMLRMIESAKLQK